MKKRLSRLVLPLLLMGGVSLVGCGQVSSSASSSIQSADSSIADGSSEDSTQQPSSQVESSISDSNSSGTETSSSDPSSSAEEISVVINGSSEVKIDDTITLTAAVSNTTDTSVSWNSSDPNIATVENGVVKGVGLGKVTITATSNKDNSKTASKEITVLDKYDVRIAEEKTYVAEVENLDLSQFVVRSDVAGIKADGAACIEESDENVYGTSGGKSIGFIGKGTIFNVSFYATEDCVITPVARMASPDPTYDVDANIEFAIDSTVVNSNGYNSFGSAEGNTYFNWKDVELTPQIISSGEHSFTYKCVGSAINLDCFKLKVTDYGTTDKYYKINQNGTTMAEVENLDLSQFVVRSDVAGIKADGAACIEESDENVYGTSGGKSIGFIGKGTIFNVSFYATEDCVITPVARMASPDPTYDVDANIEFAIDSTVVNSNGYNSFGSAEGNTYFNWKDVELTPQIISSGEHSFTYKCVGSAINLDCFKLKVTDYGTTDKYYKINQNGTTMAEVENLDLSQFVVRSDVAGIKADGAACIEESDENVYGTSGGKSIGFIGKGTVLTVSFYLADEAIVTPAARMASPDATFDVDANIEFAIDSTSVNPNGYNSFGSAEGNTYFNWKDVSLTSVSLKAGFHTFTFTCVNSAINLDGFKFVTTYYGDVASAGQQIMENGTAVVEAEAIKVSAGSYTSEAPNGDALAATSGGLSIGNVAKDTEFTVNFNLHDKATVNLVAVMAKAESDYSLDGNVLFTLDDVEQTPAPVTFGAKDTNTYWNWQDVSFFKGELAQGIHTLSLKAVNAFPNMDCIKIITTGYGDDFSVDTDKNVKIEGENVDKSNLISDGSSFIESSTEEAAATSGQSCLCHVTNGSYFEIPFYVEGTADLVITCRLSKYEALVVNDNYSIYIDNVKVDWSDASLTLGRASDGSNDWHNWVLCNGVSQSLTEGEHTFKFSFDNAGANVDYINFGFTGYTA